LGELAAVGAAAPLVVPAGDDDLVLRGDADAVFADHGPFPALVGLQAEAAVLVGVGARAAAGVGVLLGGERLEGDHPVAVRLAGDGAHAGHRGVARAAVTTPREAQREQTGHAAIKEFSDRVHNSLLCGESFVDLGDLAAADRGHVGQQVDVGAVGDEAHRAVAQAKVHPGGVPAAPGPLAGAVVARAGAAKATPRVLAVQPVS